MTKKSMMFPREVLLIEIERRCTVAACGARTRVGLTKEDARGYTGFECERCESWNQDVLTERDIPDWWEELILTSLEGLRPVASLDNVERADGGGAGEVVARLSDAWRRGTVHGGNENGDEDEPV